jgi:hypothetical protein
MEEKKKANEKKERKRAAAAAAADGGQPEDRYFRGDEAINSRTARLRVLGGQWPLQWSGGVERGGGGEGVHALELLTSSDSTAPGASMLPEAARRASIERLQGRPSLQ